MHDPKAFAEPMNSMERLEEIEQAEDQLPPDVEDLALQEEVKLGVTKQHLLEKLQKTAEKEWIEHKSKYATTDKVKRAIKEIEPEDFDEEDVELFRLFHMLMTRPSPYFRQEFPDKLGKSLRKYEPHPDSNHLFLARILEAEYSKIYGKKEAE